jgi:hypothetical protein
VPESTASHCLTASLSLSGSEPRERCIAAVDQHWRVMVPVTQIYILASCRRVHGVKTRKGAHLSVRARSCTVHVGEVVREGKPYDLALRVRLLVEAFTGKDPGVGRWR